DIQHSQWCHHVIHAQTKATGRHVSFISRALLVIYILNRMPSMRHPARINAPRPRRRALRVGSKPIVRHAWCALEGWICNTLSVLHAQAFGDIRHAIRCHPTRNLLPPGAIFSSATVPMGLFTALIVQFYGTLTPSACKVRSTNCTVACFLEC